MSVLVLGGTGFIGAPLVARLLADGVETLVAHRGAHDGARALPASATSVVVDRNDPAAVLAAVRDLGADTVIDLLAYTADDTLPLLDALSGQIARYVMASSVDVYANYEGLHRKGRPTPVWDRLTEDAALRTSRHPYRLAKPRAAGDPQAWMDDYDKIPLEEAARAASGFEATILRLPMVFGPGDRQRRFSWAIRPMVQGRPRFVIPIRGPVGGRLSAMSTTWRPESPWPPSTPGPAARPTTSAAPTPRPTSPGPPPSPST